MVSLECSNPLKQKQVSFFLVINTNQNATNSTLQQQFITTTVKSVPFNPSSIFSEVHNDSVTEL